MFNFRVYSCHSIRSVNSIVLTVSVGIALGFARVDNTMQIKSIGKTKENANGTYNKEQTIRTVDRNEECAQI